MSSIVIVKISELSKNRRFSLKMSWQRVRSVEMNIDVPVSVISWAISDTAVIVKATSLFIVPY